MPVAKCTALVSLIYAWLLVFCDMVVLVCVDKCRSYQINLAVTKNFPNKNVGKLNFM